MMSLTKIGKMIYAVPFLVFGIMHMMKAGDMAGMVPSYVPGGVLWVYITGVALIGAAVSLFTGIQIKLASILLAVLLGVFILTIHLPGVMNPEMMQMAMMSLLKDMGLAGAALVIAGSSE